MADNQFDVNNKFIKYFKLCYILFYWYLLFYIIVAGKNVISEKNFNIDACFKSIR